jgi:hypothetical protein
LPIQIPSWNSTQLAEIAEALDNLQGFDNILGLLAGADALFYGSEDGEALYHLLALPYTPSACPKKHFYGQVKFIWRSPRNAKY